ncbi:2Fe-2S iron-sulfur cluster-binding protein [Variovorax sp. M-6]|uniref:PDR/VanB family oxidoreductase n=1 Tax=Variovorax sp. M-6 TaxID=3233041 RepID=UPI003F9E659F
MTLAASRSATEPLALAVHAWRQEAEGVVSLDLRAATGEDLPPFTAGSHVAFEIPAPDGAAPLLRQYSLCNDPSERDRYLIGVGLDPASRGGSAWLHTGVEVGAVLRAQAPRNHFALDESAAHSILVAGGIGITPLLAMARRLGALGRRWTLYYCVRTPSRAAFLDVLRAIPCGEVVPVHDAMPGVASLDLPAVIASAAADTHLYCCGPAPLMQAFERAAAGRAAHTVHVEWFKAGPPAPGLAPAATAGSFALHLAHSGRTLQVPADKSVLETLLDAGIAIDSSCRDGICGSCETRVLAGTPDHHDAVLSASERAAGDRMMVCVSRCKGEALTLAL